MKEAICIFYPNEPNNKLGVKGSVHFSQSTFLEPTKITFHFEDIPPNSVRGIHIHEKGIRYGQTCMDAGPHFNPFNKNHGCIFINSENRHVGDLINNITSNENGCFDYTYLDNLVTLYGVYSVIGRTIVIHEKPDDLGLGDNKESLITGNAGGRMACSVIKQVI
jgi:Cu-Zn family superoxide dismutase